MKKEFLTEYWATLQGKGRSTFTRDEAMKELGVGKNSFLQAAERLQKKGLLAKPKQGFYVIVPPQHAKRGAPPPEWYIDPLMNHLRINYYAGILTAGTYHGATHHAVMRFQVVADSSLRDMRVGKFDIGFHYRGDFSGITTGILQKNTPTGRMNVSTPELTAIDVLRYDRSSGGMGNIATMLCDMAPKMNAISLAKLAAASDSATIQRLGFLLDWFDHENLTELLHEELDRRPHFPWIALEKRMAHSDTAPRGRNSRWRVRIHHPPEAE